MVAESHLAFGQVLAASHSLTHAINAARSAVSFIERNLAAATYATPQMLTHVRDEVGNLRELTARLEAALASLPSDMREAA